VIVDEVPAAEATMEGETRLLFDFRVMERTQTLVHRALDNSDDAEIRVTYSPTDVVASSG
jgi:hypothetical protein